jgi:hypothetical protein
VDLGLKQLISGLQEIAEILAQLLDNPAVLSVAALKQD